MIISEYNPLQTTPFSFKEKILSKLWKLINFTIFRLLPYNFRGYRRWWLKLFGAKIAKTASIDRKAIIDFPWNFTIGDLSSIGENSWIYCLDKITIGNKTCIGKDAYLITGTHEIDSPNFNLITKPINIGDGVWICTGAKILPGISIENFAVIGAFSVLSKKVHSNEVWAGIPAKFIKKRFND